MTSSLTWNSNTIYTAGGTSYRGFREWGVGLPERDVVMEPVGGTDWMIYRRTTLKGKVYGVRLMLQAATKAALDDAIATWEGYMDPSNGVKVLSRVTAGGDTLCLDAVALTPQWDDDQVGAIGKWVTQEWLAQYPYWRAASATTANGTIGGGAISCANSGNIASWPTITITGICDTPKITNAAGEYVEVNVNMTHANDVLVIDCEPHATITYTPNGGSATNYYGYRTSGSKFFRLAAGTTSVTGTASSGSAAVAVAWYKYYRALT